MNSCYETSCLCAPIRALAQCFGCRKREVRVIPHTQAHRVHLSIASVVDVGVNVPQTPLQHHHHQRSWTLKHGLMHYSFKEDEGK